MGGGKQEVVCGRFGGPVSRVLYPERFGTVTIYLASRRMPGPAVAGRRYRRSQAANPGTSRALIVPLFGLAPGGVWPPLRRRSRPGALTARFHPYPDVRFFAALRMTFASGRYVSAPLSVSRAGLIPYESLGVTQHPARWSPDFPPQTSSGRPPGPSSLLVQSSIERKGGSTRLLPVAPAKTGIYTSRTAENRI